MYCTYINQDLTSAQQGAIMIYASVKDVSVVLHAILEDVQ